MIWDSSVRCVCDGDPARLDGLIGIRLAASTQGWAARQQRSRFWSVRQHDKCCCTAA